ncbi:hypothetical protein Fot_24194 [Forsythia ovata]|uniref:Uncharacterized protein n=1 Tax=Forsythia ovata TaxID=205694 RepID=A0ABD1U5I7_9LAMI
MEEIRRSRRSTATATAASAPPTTTPPPPPVVSPLFSVALPFLPLPVPPSSAPEPTAVASEDPSTASIPTQVTSQGELDNDTGSDHGNGSQSSSESEDSSRKSPQTKHLEEEQQKSGSEFADENVEEEEESTNEENDHLSTEESVPVRLSRTQKGKQKIDERVNNAGHPSSDVPTSATHPQLFEQSLLRKVGLIINHLVAVEDVSQPQMRYSAHKLNLWASRYHENMNMDYSRP